MRVEGTQLVRVSVRNEVRGLEWKEVGVFEGVMVGGTASCLSALCAVSLAAAVVAAALSSQTAPLAAAAVADSLVV